MINVLPFPAPSQTETNFNAVITALRAIKRHQTHAIDGDLMELYMLYTWRGDSARIKNAPLKFLINDLLEGVEQRLPLFHYHILNFHF